jgi:hypothetical protein
VSLTEAATNHLVSAAGGHAAATAAAGGPLLPSVVLVAFTADGGGLITVDIRPATGD